MKKLLLSFSALLLTGIVNAQIYSSLDSAAFSSWTTYDLDGDGNNWRAAVITNPAITAPGFNGSSGFISNSWLNDPLTPDNLAASPAINCSGNSTVYLNWKAGSPETTASGWYEEQYAVYVVTASQLPNILAGTFPTPVFETTLSAGETFFNESVNISSIAANQSAVHILLRHYNCTDENWIFVKDLTVTSGMPVGIEEATNQATAYPNPATDVLNVKVDGDDVVSIQITAMDGKVVSTTLGAAAYVAELTAGIYIYEAKTVSGAVIRNTFAKK